MTTRAILGTLLFAASFVANSPEARAACDADAGMVVCGTGCIPSSATCCMYKGNAYYCKNGEPCAPSGKCGCPAGWETCMPSGNCAQPGWHCCDAVGHSEISCEDTHMCTADGQCVPLPTPAPSGHCSMSPLRRSGATRPPMLMLTFSLFAGVALRRLARRPR